MFPFPTRSFSNALPIRSNWLTLTLTFISVIQLCWYLFLKQVPSLFCSVTPCYCRYAGAQNCPPCCWRRRKQPDRHWADSLKNRCTSPSLPLLPQILDPQHPSAPSLPFLPDKTPDCIQWGWFWRPILRGIKVDRNNNQIKKMMATKCWHYDCQNVKENESRCPLTCSPSSAPSQT